MKISLGSVVDPLPVSCYIIISFMKSNVEPFYLYLLVVHVA